MLKRFFKKSKPAIKSIHTHAAQLSKEFNAAYALAKQQQKQVMEEKKKVEEQNELLLEHKQILDAFGEASGGLLNIKDRNGKFLWMNKYTCTEFFGLPESCIDAAKGLTDMDLINAYMERTGETHTFGDMCVSTDEHARRQGHRCMYIEFGKRGDTPIVLKMIKTPTTNGNIVCFGWDVSYCCVDLTQELERGIEAGSVEHLSEDVYWIKDPHQCIGNIPKTYLQ